MAKKPKKKPKKTRYAGKTEEEWKEWGEDFGDWIEERVKDFAEEIEDISEKFGKHVEKKGRDLDSRWKYWWLTTFGPIGPLLGSIFAIIVIGLGIWVLNLINLQLKITFLFLISSFVTRNLHWFFAAFLLSGYSDYLNRKYQKTYWIISPIVTSISIIFVLWISLWAVNLINNYMGFSPVSNVSMFLYRNLSGIFVLLILSGYLVTLIKKIIED